jgi:methionyl-tRNA formyltransferase
VHIAVLCATRRGFRFLEKLFALVPEADYTVFSFREETHEPPFLESIQQLTQSSGGRFHEARQVGSSRFASLWETTNFDLMFVVSWRYLIPPEVHTRPRLGSFVFHDSLLPAYRGFSPTVWAIINGEDHTGATLFEIAPDVDSGDIIAQAPVSIGQDDTIADVMERVTIRYLQLLEENISDLLNGTAQRHPQDHSQATFTCKRLPEDNKIDWTQPTENIYNLIRASTTPYPGAFTTLGGRKLTIWGARRLEKPRNYVGRIPGRIIEVIPKQGSVVLTIDGALMVTQVQFEGEATFCAAEVLNSLGQTLGR